MKKILALCLCACTVMLSACDSTADSKYNLNDAVSSAASSSAEESSKQDETSKVEESSKQDETSKAEVSSAVTEESSVQESSQTESSDAEPSQPQTSKPQTGIPAEYDIEGYGDKLYDLFSDYADAAEMMTDALDWYDVELAEAAYDDVIAALDAVAAIKPPNEYAAKHAKLVKSIDAEKEFFAKSVRLCEFGAMTDYTAEDEKELMQLVDDLGKLTEKMEFADLASDIIIEIMT
ncbi:MAG: hypothetical protein J1E39_09115 [Eubacterium sp.]|nr:hypothetical protein [Eubacterium sp.]